MSPLPENSNDHEFSCDGCKTIGTGKRFRCNTCEFDLHNYCGTCPRTLPSFMHPHPLTLVIRKSGPPKTVDRVCDLCRETVNGLFYRCKECEFDVHPLCTQLSEKLNHALHKLHPLILQSSSAAAGICAVCRRTCGGWRYGCRVCRVDIHLECVLEPVVDYQQHNHSSGQRGIPGFDQNTGIPFQAPPFYEYPYGQDYQNYGPGPGFNTYPYENFAPQQAQNLQMGAGNSNNGNRVGKSMFGIVSRLGIGVVSNMIFGVDVSGFWVIY